MAQSQLELPETTQAEEVVAGVVDAVEVADVKAGGPKRANHHAVSVAKRFLAASVSLRVIRVKSFCCLGMMHEDPCGCF